MDINQNNLPKACSTGYGWMVDLVLEALRRGVSPNCQDEAGDTPLIKACLNDDRDLVEELLKHGARMDEQNKEGLTALHIAIYHAEDDIAYRLIEEGASATLADLQGRTALDWAIELNKVDLAQAIKARDSKIGLMGLKATKPTATRIM